MSDTFDPYQAWLGIPPEEQPPNLYRLLGIRPFEEDAAAIQDAAESRAGQLNAFQYSVHAELARKLLEEVANAKACLLDCDRKGGYDEALGRAVLAGEGSAAGERSLGERFLALIEERNLLPAKLVGSLRKRLAQAERPIPAATVAKRLVKAGYLTPSLAQELLAALSAESPGQVSPPAATTRTSTAVTPPKPVEISLDEPEEEYDLGLAPLEEDRPTRPAARRQLPGDTSRPKTPTEEASAESAPSRSTAAFASKGAGAKPPEPPPVARVRSAGSLDSLVSDTDLDAAGSPTDTPRKKGLRRLSRSRRKTIGGGRQWDSSLMLLGGGTLLVLLILAPVLIWAVTRQSGDDALQQADAEYRAGSYTQAIHKYNLYLKKFPKHNGVTSARVNRGLAQLRQATPRGTRDWPAALLIAKKVISEIAPEPQFNTAHGDLAVILLAIAEGLSAQAKENPEPGVVEQTEETLALMEKYVPRSLQRGDRIAEIRALLGLAEREIDCERELQERTAAMREAVGQGDLRHAYEIRKALLKRYPRLVDNEQLEQAVLEVSQAQQAAVNLISQKQLPETTDELLPTVTLGQSNPTAEVPGAEGQVAFAAAAGAVYGIEATTGKVLWRRFVGFDGNGRCPSFPPTPISPETGADALLVNSTSRELQRVDATTGDLRWRISIGEDFEAHPVIAGNRILVATRSGRIVTIDAASGGSSAYIQVPQSLQVAPAVDLTRSLLFQLADHSNLFVLGLDDGQCKSVVHLGHELGSITSPPVVVSRFLLVTVNDRSKDSQLLVFTIDETADGPALQPVQQLRLNGHVDTPPKLAGRQVLIVTDLGAVYVLEVGGPEAKQPLREAVEPTPASGQRLIRYPLIQGNRAWVADVELTRYDIQANVSRLSPQGISDENSVFLQPPVAAGEAIVHVRRKVGMPGVIVSAVEKHEPNVYWETYLAVPLVAGPEVDPGDGAITAVTSRGAQFRMDAAKLRERTVASVPMVAVEAAQLHGPIVSLARLGNGLLVLCGGNGSQEIAVCDPRQQPMRFQWRPLPDPLACSPVAFADGLLAPSKTGVFFLDPLTGNKTEPFPPQLEPGGQLAWQTPTLFGENQAILADGQNRLYRLGVNDKPRPHLAAIDQMTMPQPIVSPVAVLGEVAYAVDAGKTLQVLKLPKLTRLEDRQRLLGGPCVWGPRRVGESVMLSTDDQLLCLDAMGHLVWQVELPYGPLAGAPLAAGDHYVMAAAGGVIWRVEAVTGRELSQVDSGRPLATGPVLLGSRLLLGGHDGSLYLVEPPPAR